MADAVLLFYSIYPYPPTDIDYILYFLYFRGKNNLIGIKNKDLSVQKSVQTCFFLVQKVQKLV